MNYFTCWFAWDSIGNSNWFVFDILALYLVVYVGMIISKKVLCNSSSKAGLLLIGSSIIGTLVLFILLYFSKPGMPWWINTLFTFPLGLAYSYFKEQIDDLLKVKKYYWPIVVALGLVFLLWYKHFRVDGYGVSSLLFTLSLVLLTMKVQLHNPILDWLGTNAFSIYILQRLPMNVLKFYGVNDNVQLFSIVSIILVLLLAWGFTYLLSIVDSKLFPLKHNKIVNN